VTWRDLVLGLAVVGLVLVVVDQRARYGRLLAVERARAVQAERELGRSVEALAVARRDGCAVDAGDLARELGELRALCSGATERVLELGETCVLPRHLDVRRADVPAVGEVLGDELGGAGEGEPAAGMLGGRPVWPEGLGAPIDLDGVAVVGGRLDVVVGADGLVGVDGADGAEGQGEDREGPGRVSHGDAPSGG